MMPSANLQVSEWIIESLIQQGMDHFVISPGSRSTPLTIAAARNPKAITHTHFDERGAAYFALGVSRARKQASVLICTSGSAVANYFPAVIEASMDNIPLVVLTADRPPELIGVGANQAIYQDQIFGRYPRAFEKLDPPCPSIQDETLHSLLHRLLLPLYGSTPGPVHLNCQFREPFLEGSDTPVMALSPLPALHAEHPPLNEDFLPGIQEVMTGANRGLIVVGRGLSPDFERRLIELANLWGCPILPDVQSSLRYHSHNQIISHFDLVLLRETFQHEKADIIFHFGGMYTSKRLLQYLDDDTIFYVSLKETAETIDPNHQVNISCTGNLEKMLLQLRSIPFNSEPRWLSLFQEHEKWVSDFLDDHFSRDDRLSEPSLIRALASIIPHGHSLMLGNSMPIRDMEMFAPSDIQATGIFGNRGTSGIDGLMATTAGIASGSGQPTTIVMGDLSFLHDLNALALISRLPQQVIVVVINNGGGGIFHFLPVKQEQDVFEEFFGTPHAFSFEHAALMFDLDYAKPDTIGDFRSIYNTMIKSGDSAIIEVASDREQNLKIHRDLFASIRGL